MNTISVILPNYNHAAFLQERIESILQQTYTAFELIILDDCSTDNSRNIIDQYKSHPKVSQIIYAEKNSGSPFKQWAKGILLAKNNWIWIAESDDKANPDFLTKLSAELREHPSTGLAYCNAAIESSNDIQQPFQNTAQVSNNDFETTHWNNNFTDSPNSSINYYFKKKNAILNVSSALFNKEHLLSYVSELEKFKLYGDWYAYILIAAASDIRYCNTELSVFRRHSNSIIHTAKNKNIKTDCFRILNLLMKQEVVANKKELINYFVNSYLNTGIKSEGIVFTLHIVFKYFTINPSLATRVIRIMIQTKFNNKKY